MKHLATITLITIFLGIVLTAYVLCLLFYPVKTLEVTNEPMPIVSSNIVKAGDYVTYQYEYCKYYDYPSSVKKEFVDGIIFEAEGQPIIKLEKGCHIKDVAVQIPETLPAGEYKIRITTEIAINQLRTETVIYETGLFKVVK